MKPSYQARFLTDADSLFEQLLELEWLELTEARKEYFMSTEPRSYIYGTPPYAREYHSEPYIPSVTAVQNQLNSHLNADFNICFLNRYDNQKQQLGWHADDSPTMDTTHPIAVVSLGAEREIWWKLQEAKGQVPPEQRQKLAHGSIFVMPPGFQEDWFHRIPRCERSVGVRVSLTFRRYIPEVR